MSTTSVLNMFDGTSTGCAMCGSPVVRAGAVALCLLFNGMSAPATASTTYHVNAATPTTTGPQSQVDVSPVVSTGAAVLEVRRRTGLTWDQLADMFEVSRRSVHHWANGQVVSAVHEHAIRQTLLVVRHLDQGTSAATRDLLLTVDVTGATAFGLLKDGRYSEAMRRIGNGVTQAPHARRIPLSQKALEARRPPSPGLLFGGTEERVDIPSKARIARVMRVPKVTG